MLVRFSNPLALGASDWWHVWLAGTLCQLPFERRQLDCCQICSTPGSSRMPHCTVCCIVLQLVAFCRRGWTCLSWQWGTELCPNIPLRDASTQIELFCDLLLWILCWTSTLYSAVAHSVVHNHTLCTSAHCKAVQGSIELFPSSALAQPLTRTWLEHVPISPFFSHNHRI